MQSVHNLLTKRNVGIFVFTLPRKKKKYWISLRDTGNVTGGSSRRSSSLCTRCQVAQKITQRNPRSQSCCTNRGAKTAQSLSHCQDIWKTIQRRRSQSIVAFLILSSIIREQSISHCMSHGVKTVPSPCHRHGFWKRIQRIWSQNIVALPSPSPGHCTSHGAKICWNPYHHRGFWMTIQRSQSAIVCWTWRSRVPTQSISRCTNCGVKTFQKLHRCHQIFWRTMLHVCQVTSSSPGLCRDRISCVPGDLLPRFK